MTSAVCPVCGGGLAIPGTGRRPVYCGKPCRQAAHRARQAAARMADHAGWLRQELAGVGARGQQTGLERDFHQVVNAMLAALARIHDYPRPTGDRVPSGWEPEVIRAADSVRRMAGRAFDLAGAHARAAGDFTAANAVFRRAPAPDPDDDETAPGFVAARGAGDRATEHAGRGESGN